MTSKTYLDNYLVKQAALNPLAEMALYMAPITGELLSGRDALRNVGGMGKALIKGNWRKLGTQSLQALGNTAMMLAGLIPGGSSIRTAVKAKKLAKGTKGLTKFLKGINKVDDGIDVVRLARGSRQSKHFLKGLTRASKGKGAAGALSAKGLSEITNAKSVDELINLARIHSSKFKNMKARKGIYVKGTQDYMNYRQALKVQKQIANAANSAAGFGRGVTGRSMGLLSGGPGGLRGLEGIMQGRMVGGVANRLTPKQLELWERLARGGAFKTYGRAQFGGLGVAVAGGFPEELGWAKPTMAPDTGTRRLLGSTYGLGY